MTNDNEDDDIIEDYELRMKLMRENEQARRRLEKHKWERVASLLREILIIVEGEL